MLLNESWLEVLILALICWHKTANSPLLVLFQTLFADIYIVSLLDWTVSWIILNHYKSDQYLCFVWVMCTVEMHWMLVLLITTHYCTSGCPHKWLSGVWTTLYADWNLWQPSLSPTGLAPTRLKHTLNFVKDWSQPYLMYISDCTYRHCLGDDHSLNSNHCYTKLQMFYDSEWTL